MKVQVLRTMEGEVTGKEFVKFTGFACITYVVDVVSIGEEAKVAVDG